MATTIIETETASGNPKAARKTAIAAAVKTMARIKYLFFDM